DRLHIDSLHAAAGCSYGGMVALELAARAPERMERCIAIAAAPETRPIATAWRSLQRRLVRLGAAHGCAGEALAIARALGMTTYRSAAEFERRFVKEPAWRGGRAFFAVESYLEARGERFAREFDAAAYHCLSESIDLHKIEPEAIGVPTTVITFSTDQLVPPEQGRELAERIAAPARHVAIESEYGHDAFLKELEPLARELRRALEEVRP
ncbi:MAG: alpha/beta fold hydrolase, partial [Planctomycetes bacterium]|nr:alpha/beta fold hydrolase [Planctomycetota bacterium]